MSHPVRQVLLVYTAVTVLVAGLGILGVVDALRDATHLCIAALFLFVPLAIARRKPGDARRMGIDLAGLLATEEMEAKGRSPGPLGLFDLVRAIRDALPVAMRETGAALLVAGILFPPFVFGFWIWHQPTYGFVWNPPEDASSFVLTQFVLVALPEEVFFRGFVQSRLADAWPARRRWLGVSVHPGVLVAQAILFALVHLATGFVPAKLATFFPGLLFGLVRAWRKGVGAAVVLHALSNVLAEWLVRGFLL